MANSDQVTWPRLIPRKAAVACSFDHTGKVVRYEGDFLQLELAVNNNVYDSCYFLLGVVEDITPTESIRLDGVHLTVNEQHYIIDAAVVKKADSSCILMLQDETEKYRLINQMSQQRNQADILKHQLERQNDTLKLLKAAAETGTRVRTEFLAKMSHEIRTPLNALLGFTDLLSDTKLSNNQANHISNIQTAGKALSSLLNDILDLSRMEAGKYDLVISEFNPQIIAKEALSLCQLQASTKSIELLFDTSPDMPETLQGDQSRLSQIILNLLTNAIKFTTDGHVKLSLTLGEKTDTSQKITIIVEDTGRGISENQQTHIFETFAQSETNDATELGGIGLGLAIVKQLVDAMNGTIDVASEVGKGTTFTIQIPFKQSAPGEKALTINETSQTYTDNESNESLQDTTILIAEDNILNQQYIAEILRAKGCQVLVVGNGATALQTILTTPIDLVLMDMMMPQMNGDEAIQKIRTEFLYPLNQIPVITSSGKSTAEDSARYLQLGANSILTKPYSSIALTQKAYEVLIDAKKSTHSEVDTRLSYDISTEMIELYKTHTPEYLREILFALHNQNEKQFVFQAHKLQSVMWVMGYTEQFEILERLENETLNFDQRLMLCKSVCQNVEDSLRPLSMH